MQAIYTQQPSDVAVFPTDMGTDVFLRWDIQQTADPESGQAIWTCEEAQGRVSEPVTEEEIEADFDYWLDLLSGANQQEDRLSAEQMRADIDFIAVMSGIDLGV